MENSNFKNEYDFGTNIVNELIRKGWVGYSQKECDDENTESFSKNNNILLHNCTEEDLKQNWRRIIFNNNKDKLNGVELSDNEFDQLLEIVNNIQNTAQANKLINSEQWEIVRDQNSKDTKNAGSPVYLSIFRRKDVKAGNSVYQIAREVNLSKNPSSNVDRRADLMLLINGLPVIYIELKNQNVNSGIDQIRNYTQQNRFEGLFKLLQLSVVMTPNDMVFQPTARDHNNVIRSLFSNWHNVKNEKISNWLDVIRNFLQIPMAHRLISDFSVPDESDGSLKFLRSYQYHAVNEIEKRLKKENFFSKVSETSQKGGYIWHTTGSGKTLTSFKLCKLILDWNLADTVVFVVDRVELGSQSLTEFSNFKGDSISVKQASSTYDLIRMMKSNNVEKSIIISSIFKQARIDKDKDLDKINQKRTVFIFDEAHRSTFGDMHADIIKNFKNAVIFGFTGTPITPTNKKNDLTTSDLFGPELHAYTIKNAIEDGKVLRFHTEFVLFETLFRDAMGKMIANGHPKAYVENNLAHDWTDIAKKFVSENNQYEDINIEIEHKLDEYGYFDNINFKKEVVKSILRDNKTNATDSNFKFSSILATNSISDAITYFELFEEEIKQRNLQDTFKFSALFDSSLDRETNDEDQLERKDQAIGKILNQYNADFDVKFDYSRFDDFRTDLSYRLAHKKTHVNVEKHKQLDLLIVVNQMLTGFDSKYINTVYFDKDNKMQYENLIQAMSRTNRVLNEQKPFGKVFFFRKPHIMKRNLENALKIYVRANTATVGVGKANDFVETINKNKKILNDIFENRWGIKDFSSIKTIEPGMGNAKMIEEEYRSVRSAFNALYRAQIAVKLLGGSLDNNPEAEYVHDPVDLSDSELQALKARFIDIQNYFSSKPTIEHSENWKLDLEEGDGFFFSFNFEINNNYLNELITTGEYERAFEYINTFPEKTQKRLNEILFDIMHKKIEFTENDDILVILQHNINFETKARIEEFATNYNLDSNLLRNVVYSSDDINKNNQLDNIYLNNNWLIAREYIAKSENRNIYKINKLEVKSKIMDFINKEREAQKNI
ncbi:HsdR family type I site-specific deoxyribonuclease [Mycoplasma simbae]|uniref:HsdR family type I site-specific deoxyribonuclease n=1 Tax=Mycoplasma simbae TaxID=36744 RepID=UPI000495686B|nr:HsdR family type I site-specific deoxyribonuclease [Mycoplasma simbae]